MTFTNKSKLISGILLLIISLWSADYVLPKQDIKHIRNGAKIKRYPVRPGSGSGEVFYMKTLNNELIKVPVYVFTQIPEGSEFVLSRTPIFHNNASIKLNVNNVSNVIEIPQLLDANIVRILFLVISVISVSCILGIIKIDIGNSIAILSFIIFFIIIYSLMTG